MKHIQPFADWPIQNDLLRTLHARMEQGKIPHAILLVGDHSQTRSLSEYLAKILLCQSDMAPCGECSACLQMEAANHPDFYLVQPAESGTVKTAQIESVQEKLALRSHTGGNLVYCIQGIDTLTPVAANRLLKTLEEPAPSVYAILTAANQQRVLPTVLSRCFLFALQNGNSSRGWDDPISIAMTKSENPDSEDSFARISRAVVQWAENLLTNREGSIMFADSLVKLADDIELEQVLQLLSLWLRDLVHYRSGDREHIQFIQYQEALEQQSKLAHESQFVRAIELVIEAKRRLKSHVAAGLNTQQMCIRLREELNSV